MLVAFALPAGIQFIIGLVFIVITHGPRESSRQTSLLGADCPPYIVWVNFGNIPYNLTLNICLLDMGDSSRQRVAYGYLFLAYGQDIPLDLPRASETSYHRHHIIPDSAPIFLLGVWITFDLADPPENYDQGFLTILPSGHCIALNGGPVQDEI